MKSKIPLLACGIFREEWAQLPESLSSLFEPRFLASMLHMRPDLLDLELQKNLSSPLVLLYGDCSPHLRDFASGEGRGSCAGQNCCEILLGRDRYRELLREGSFFFMPEWIRRWEEVFKTQLGLSTAELASSFMRDNAKSLVYIDTGSSPLPRAELEAASAYLGLPWKVEATGLEGLTRALEAALEEALPGPL